MDGMVTGFGHQPLDCCVLLDHVADAVMCGMLGDGDEVLSPSGTPVDTNGVKGADAVAPSGDATMADTNGETLLMHLAPAQEVL